MSQYPPLTDAERHLRDALTLPEELRTQIEALCTPEGNFRLQIFHEDDPLGAAGIAALLRFAYLSEANTPLPSELALYSQSGRGNEIALTISGMDERTTWRITRFAAGQRNAFSPEDGIQQLVNSHYRARETQIRSAFRGWIEESPAYRTLKALAHASTELREAPTPPHIQETQKQRVEEELARLYPAGSKVDLPGSGGPANRERYRRHTQIEEGTSRQRRSGNTRQRVLAWLCHEASNNIDEWVENAREGERITHIAFSNPQSDNLTLHTSHQRDVTASIDALTTWSSAWGEERDSTLFAPSEFFHSRELAVDFVVHLLADPSATPEQALAAAREQNVDLYFESLTAFSSSPIELALRLKQPQTPIYAQRPPVADTHRQRTPANAPTSPLAPSTPPRKGWERRVVIDSEENARELASSCVARVLHRDIWDGRNRLIYDDALEPESTLEQFTRAEGYELALQFDEGTQWESAPTIPGYITSAHDPESNIWGFMRADEDPHRSADALHIDPQACARIAQRCDAAGFTWMAHELRDATHGESSITLNDLADLIEYTSVYTYDTDTPEVSLRDPDNPQIEEFAPAMKEGRLHTQCTGADAFLAACIRDARPDAEVVSLKGWVLSAEDTVSRAPHAQTGLRVDGTYCITDATPRGVSGLDPRTSSATPSVYRTYSDGRAQIDLTATLDAARQQRAEHSAEVLYHTLRTALNVPDSLPHTAPIAKYAAKRKPGDPLRRVVETLLQSTQEKFTEQSNRTTRYLDNITRAAHTDRALYRQLVHQWGPLQGGPEECFPGVLDEITTNLRELSQGDLPPTLRRATALRHGPPPLPASGAQRGSISR